VSAAFLLPASLLVAVFFLVPVVATVALSFTDLSTATFGDPSWIGFDNYRDIFRSRFTPLILANTIRYVATTLFFNVGMGLFLAIATSQVPARLGDHLRALWLLPRISSPVVYVLLWSSLLSEAPHGLVSQLAGESKNWIHAHPWTVIVLANGFVGASMGMLIFTSAIRSIPRSLFDAAAVDGAGTRQTVFRIVLPLLRWPILFVTTYQTLSLLTSFEYILLLTDGGPGFYRTEVWALRAYHEAFATYHANALFGLGAAMAALLVAAGIALSLVYLKVFRFRELVGGGAR
jgi:inositol-phosphate transport system permease protein